MPEPVAHVNESDEPIAAGPPEEEFWDRYNKRLEIPLAAVITVFLHVVVASVLVYVIVGLMGSDDRSGPPVQLLTVGGMDDAGEGSAGSGGIADPDIIQNVSPLTAAQHILPTPEAIQAAKEQVQRTVLDDPAGKIPISPSNAAAYSQLDEDLRKKLLGVGARKGAGNEAGTGNDGTAGTGPGGSGADSTYRRSLRWVLRFRIANGRDYISQLQTMGAEILIPIPGSNDRLLVDVNNPSVKRKATDADLARLAKMIQFNDTRRDAVQGVAVALGLDFTPKVFFACFPKSMEDILARKETNYRNRRAEDIEETIFRVTVRGGSYELIVDEQTAKK